MILASEPRQEVAVFLIIHIFGQWVGFREARVAAM